LFNFSVEILQFVPHEQLNTLVFTEDKLAILNISTKLSCYNFSKITGFGKQILVFLKVMIDFSEIPVALLVRDLTGVWFWKRVADTCCLEEILENPG